MSERFYQQQLKATGNCPGAKPTKRKQKMSTWTDELKAEVIKEYVSREATPETSVEIVKELAEEYEQSPNGVRMILSKAGVYVTKSAATAAKTGSTTKATAGARVSKADAQATLVAAIEATGQTADEELISKMTGKAMMYFAGVISKSETESKDEVA